MVLVVSRVIIHEGGEAWDVVAGRSRWDGLRQESHGGRRARVNGHREGSGLHNTNGSGRTFMVRANTKLSSSGAPRRLASLPASVAPEIVVGHDGRVGRA